MSPIATLAAFFVVVMGSVTLVGYVILNRRAQQAQAPDTPDDSPAPSLLQETLLRVSGAAPANASQSERSQKQLAQAGYRQANALQLFFGAKLASAFALGFTFFVVKMLVDPDFSGALVALIAGGGMGFLIPHRVLEFLVKRRERRLLFAVPTAIDLLVLSLEAGQSLDASLSETARELRSGYPELASELNQVLMEMVASRGRNEVFRAMRDRNTEPEVKKLAQVFIDSDRFGTSLAPALRTHVKYLRARLRQQAQEQARKVSVKLIFPVFFLIFPAVILVTLGPAVLQIYSQLGPLVNAK